MKVGSYLSALLAFGALSTNVAAAEKPRTAVAAGIALKHDSNTKAAIGTAPATNPSPAAAQIGNRALGTATPAVVGGNAPSINGTGMARPGSGTGAVGGPAKAAAGVLNGNSVQLKHP
jgi:hypothetical protein